MDTTTHTTPTRAQQWASVMDERRLMLARLQNEQLRPTRDEDPPACRAVTVAVEPVSASGRAARPHRHLAAVHTEAGAA